MRRLRSISLALACCLPVAAAGTPFFRHLGTRDGLAHPSVMSVCQDSLGRIWFGTENGVSMYDGNRTVSSTPYDVRDGRVLFRGGVVKPLLCDPGGNVWFLTEYEAVRHDVRTGRMEVVGEGAVTALYLDHGEPCVIIGRERFRWDAAGHRLVPAGMMPFEGIRDCLAASDGKTWIIGPDGLFVAEDGWSFRKVSAIGDLQALFESSRQEIWCGSNQEGLLRIFPDGHIVHYRAGTDAARGFRNDNIRTVAEDGAGRIWFGTFQGLYRYDPDTDRFTAYLREDREGGLSQSSVHSVFVDRDGILWAGTYYGGVNFTDTRPGAFSFYPATDGPEGLSHPVVGHLAEDWSGGVWVCTEGGGLDHLDPQTGRIRHLQPRVNAKWLAAGADPDVLYLATNRRGLYRMNLSSGTYAPEIDLGEGFSPFAIVNVVVRYGDDLFLSTDDGVYVHSCRTKADSLLYPRTDGVRYVHLLLRGDELWLASSSVVVFDATTRRKKAEYPLQADGVRVRPMRLAAGPEGAVYATTFGHGLFRLGPDGFAPFPAGAPSPMMSSSGYQIIPAGGGRMLLSGEKGIHLLDPSGVLIKTFLPGKNLPLDAQVLDSGLLLTGDGTVYAGGTNGLVSFRLDGGGGPDGDGLYLSDLYVDGSPVLAGDASGILSEALPFTGAIRLKGTQSRLDVHLASRHRITDLDWPDYEYRLKGRDDRWQEVVEPVLSWSDLPVGTYQVQVRRRGTEDAACTLDVDIRPFWWATWWMRMLALVLALAVGFTLLRAFRLRREARRAVEEERREKARLQEINETKLRFFTTVSHELRTPLTLIIAQIESVLDTFRLPPQVRGKMGKVKDQAGQMNRLVTELIDFRKFEQDLVTLHVSPCAVNPFLGDLFDRFKEMAAAKSVSLHFNPAAEQPVVYLDAYQMQKVVMNLLFNAVKFTPEGGRIDLSVVAGPEGPVCIHVRDNGIGIRAEDLPHIFERFYQASGNGADTGIPGSGIGLALARDIVERHGGTIAAESRYGDGTDFSVTLLRGTDHWAGNGHVVIEEAASVPEPAGPETASRAGSGGAVVIAEDNAEMASLLRELFSVQYTVFSAPDGREALRLVQEHHPDLVVSDVMMPVMTGTELCSAIKGDARLADIPVVLLTALDGSEQQLGGLLKGADDYVAKPFQSRVLLARCNNLVRRRRGAASDGGASTLPAQATTPDDKAFLERLSAFIDAHISDPGLNNDSLADWMNMSRSSFYHRFKEVTSETPNDYITSIRLQKAAALLRAEPGLPVAEIADRLGFSTQNYFCRRFKARFGVSPTAYRKP